MDKQRPVFIVRAEREGEAEELNLEEGVCSIGWGNTLNPFEHSREEIIAFGATHWFTEDGRVARDAPHMIWRFTHESDLDDAVIVLPCLHPDHHGELMVGICTGAAYWVEDAKGDEAHPRMRRPVTWKKEVILRASLSAATQEWLNRVQHTVRQVQSEEVKQELRALAEEHGQAAHR
jgi:predicted Mrr-cat superfamily restriction endonuclease